MEQREFNLKVSRLLGEIQQLAVLFNLETKMVCQAQYFPHVNEFDFALCPDKEAFMKKYEISFADKVVIANFYLSRTFNETEEERTEKIKKLLKIKRLLIKTLKANGIDFKNPDLTREQMSYTYYKVVI